MDPLSRHRYLRGAEAAGEQVEPAPLVRAKKEEEALLPGGQTLIRLDAFQVKLTEKISNRRSNARMANKLKARPVDELAREAADDFAQTQVRRPRNESPSAGLQRRERGASADSNSSPVQLQKIKIKQKFRGGAESPLDMSQYPEQAARKGRGAQTSHGRRPLVQRTTSLAAHRAGVGDSRIGKAASSAVPGPRDKLRSQVLHNCANADSRALGTAFRHGGQGVGVSDMSTKMKLNNLAVQSELASLERVDIRHRTGGRPAADLSQFEVKKNEINKELIKLQQKMKQIVTTKEERYIELRFNEFTKVVVVEETAMLLKLDLLGAESPVVFTCEMLDNTDADLRIYLSTEHPEPDEKKCQRSVERMRVFKFGAK